MDYVRCPNCNAWMPPGGPTCQHCGAAPQTTATVTAPQPPTPARFLEPAAAIRRLSATCWGIMWLAFIVNIFCAIALMQVDPLHPSSDPLPLLLGLAAALAMAIAVTRLADAAGMQRRRQVCLFAIALLIPLAGMLVGRKLRMTLRRLAKEAASKAQPPASV